MESNLNNLIEGQKVSRFDMALYMVKNILEMLNENDTVSVLTFSDYSKFLSCSLPVTEQNKKTILISLENVNPAGTTNLWDAIKSSYSFLFKNNCLKSKQDFVNNHIMVLTDGEPNVTPQGVSNCSLTSKEFTDSLKEFLSICPVKACLHLVGTCPDSLNDQILGDLAEAGNGMYGFVSDPVILSCCAINIMSMIFNMSFTNLTFQYGDVKYNLPWVLQDGYTYLRLNNVHQDPEIKLYSNQNRVFPIKINRVEEKVFDSFKLGNVIANKLLEIKPQDELKDKISEIVVFLKVSYMDYNCQKFIDVLTSDVDIYKRIKQESIQSWGKYCVYSLAQSIKNGYITNPYEMSYKFLAGERLKFWNEFIEDAVKNIGKPTTKKITGYTSRDSNYNFSSYSCSSISPKQDDWNDGCILGDCLVEMANGEYKNVDCIVRGDPVATDRGVGVISKVVIDKADRYILLPNGLKITPNHPIYHNNKWILPKDHPEGKMVVLSESVNVYSFLLEKSDSNAMIINRKLVVHFAHNNNDPVLNHPFYGTEKVRENLERLKCDYEGKIRIKGAERDANNMVVMYF
jgi:hypothetical protein